MSALDDIRFRANLECEDERDYLNAKEDRARLLGALDAVLELHQPLLEDGTPVGCACCDWNVRGNDVWPCPTVAAVNDALEAGKC